MRRPVDVRSEALAAGVAEMPRLPQPRVLLAEVGVGTMVVVRWAADPMAGALVVDSLVAVSGEAVLMVAGLGAAVTAAGVVKANFQLLSAKQRGVADSSNAEAYCS